MSTPPDDAVLADEQAVNARYIARLEQRAERPVLVAAYSSSARKTAPTGSRKPEIAPFLGRVAFDRPVPGLASDSFYVGIRWWSDGGIDVLNWAAPQARCWFEPRLVTHGPSVVAVRAFTARGDRLVGYADERVDGGTGPTALDRRRALTVAAPPRRAARRPRASAAGGPTAAPDHPEPTVVPPATPAMVTPVPRQRRAAETPPVVAEPASPTPARPSRPPRPATNDASPPPRRFAAALSQALEAPRRDGLRHVLATLQPDQYRLVTHPAEEPLLIQGHPGSGKTIVATHRAAYLVDEDRSRAGQRRPRVLLVGPTRRFVEHARGVLTALGVEEHVDVMSLDALLATVAGVAPPSREDTVAGDSLEHHDEHLGWVVEAVARRLFGRSPGEAGATAQPRRRRRLYEALAGHVAAVAHRDWEDLVTHVHGLPDWAGARVWRRHLPLMAHCALVADGSPPPELRYDHVIVDEAQDVPPLEWRTLARLNVGGAWTVVGDLNQRRSDWSFSSWEDIAEAVGVDEPDLQCFGTAYRSTQAVLAYANKLLPARERAVTNVRLAGEKPEVVRVRKHEDLATTTFEVAARLADRHPEGSTAVISPRHGDVATVAVRHGFQQRRAGDAWRRGEVEMHFLSPEEARGLEFDAVVVMEPADFPAQLGRYGVLFTALTRANKELAVVHREPLPDPLRRR